MDALALTDTVVEVIEKEEDFTPERLAALDILYQPERVIVEYNGMWLVSKFEKMQKPKGCLLYTSSMTRSVPSPSARRRISCW